RVAFGGYRLWIAGGAAHGGGRLFPRRHQEVVIFGGARATQRRGARTRAAGRPVLISKLVRQAVEPLLANVGRDGRRTVSIPESQAAERGGLASREPDPSSDEQAHRPSSFHAPGPP